jgi:hypothetical protein
LSVAPRAKYLLRLWQRARRASRPRPFPDG